MELLQTSSWIFLLAFLASFELQNRLVIKLAYTNFTYITLVILNLKPNGKKFNMFIMQLLYFTWLYSPSPNVFDKLESDYFSNKLSLIFLRAKIEMVFFCTNEFARKFKWDA